MHSDCKHDSQSQSEHLVLLTLLLFLPYRLLQTRDLSRPVFAGLNFTILESARVQNNSELANDAIIPLKSGV